MFFSNAEAAVAVQTNEYLRQALNRLAGGVDRYDRSIPNKATIRKAMRKLRSTIINRADVRSIETYNLYKWVRPWEVVPKLKEFRPPADDFGIGVEVEHGFLTTDGATSICKAIANWKYVTLDYEGGHVPLEVTFPPVLHSKMSSRSQCMRYLKLLEKNADLLASHRGMVGTHVNISSTPQVAHERIHAVNTALSRDSYGDFRWNLTGAQMMRYFNRTPYSTLHIRSHGVEYKLFNSLPDPKVLRKYIEIAVALHKLMLSTDPINTASVVAACESGYKEACRKNRVKYNPPTVS